MLSALSQGPGGMKKIFLIGGMWLLGSLIISPAVAAFQPGHMPGDISFNMGQTHIFIPIFYSLCASLGLTLLYRLLTR